MCSIDTDGFIEMVKKVDLNEISDVCRKCNAVGSKILLRDSDVYCNSCFLTYFVHKFRSTIGKSKQIKPNDKVLLAFSGGPNSSALLHLTKQGLDEVSHKKLRYDPSFIHICENEDLKICSTVTDLNFRCYYVNLEEVFSPKEICIMQYEKDKENFLPVSNYKKTFVEALNASNSSTSKEDMIDQLKTELICRCASALGFKKVFLADNCSKLSIRILSDIALGRGSQLSGHVQFKTTHFGIEVFRPLREIQENEINFFLQIENIPITSTSNDTIHSKQSISSCTKDFLLGLQKDFPSTVPTVFKTGNKLVSGNFDSVGSSNATSRRTSISEDTTVASEETLSIFDADKLCAFCGFVKDTHAGPSSALEAVQVSRLMSKLQPTNSIFQELKLTHPKRIEGDEELTIENIQDNLCYACINLFKEANSLEVVPPRVIEDCKKRKANNMFNLIQDFLL